MVICAFLIGVAGAQAKAAKSPKAKPGTVVILSQDPETNGCVGDVGEINHPSCTANDVRLTSIVEGSLVLFGNCQEADHTGSQALCEEDTDCSGTETCQGKGCTDLAGDKVTFSATGRFVAGPQRYDIGLYIAADTDSDGNGARFGKCTRFAFDNGEGSPDLPDNDGDTCGDMDPNTTYEIDFGPVTIFCVDAKSPGETLDDPPVNTPDGQADVNHCETWANNADQVPAQNTDCDDSLDVRAGTGSKCFCGLLAGACIAIDDASDCTLDICRGTCQLADGTGTKTVCEDNGDCTSPETCRNITLQHISDTTQVCRPSAGPCDVEEKCAADGSCPADAFKSLTTTCRPAADCCDVAESCTGNSAACPADGFQPATTICRPSDGSKCDLAESCTGNSASCPADSCATTADPADACVSS
jgi:hypothetical protein